MALLIDFPDPVGERETLVRSKGPDIAGHGSEVSHVAADEKDQHEGKKDCHPFL